MAHRRWAGAPNIEEAGRWRGLWRGEVRKKVAAVRRLLQNEKLKTARNRKYGVLPVSFRSTF